MMNLETPNLIIAGDHSRDFMVAFESTIIQR